MLWFLIGAGVFVVAVFFMEETETETVGRAALSTLGLVASAGFLMVVGTAIWPWY